MSDSHQTKPAAAHAAVDEHPVDFNKYVRLCAVIFVAVLCAVGAMIYISYLPHYSWMAKVAMILTVATVNAFLVAGFLMHLLSEKKLIYTVLAFTVFFVTGLFALTLYAMHDFPAGTQLH
jgi:caa(3)-type oxidase subunit IV